jgi:hypothetical protein
MVMIESEGIAKNARSWSTGVISAVNAALPSDKVL